MKKKPQELEEQLNKVTPVMGNPEEETYSLEDIMREFGGWSKPEEPEPEPVPEVVPEPEIPVITTNLPRGISTVTSLRLLTFALRIIMLPSSFFIRPEPEKKSELTKLRKFLHLSALPQKTNRRPSGPPVI